MALISCQQLRIAFGGPLLLDSANLQVERGERVGLLGRNGEGKSTLLKMIMGDVTADSGEIVLESGTRVSLVRQELPVGLEGSALEVIASGTDTPRPKSIMRLAYARSSISIPNSRSRRCRVGRRGVRF